MPCITVVGAGVSGLVSAWTLTEAGADVSIIAARRGRETTSSVAAAIWMPYLCEPRDRVLRWSHDTYVWLERLASETPGAGVDMLTLDEAGDGERPWWFAALPAGERVEHVAAGRLRRPAWRVRVPRVDPPVFIEWIESRLAERGVEIRERQVRSLGEVEGDVIVNCTGLGASSLCADVRLEARFGQVVVARPGAWSMTEAAADERGEITYVIPRREVLVLGGISRAQAGCEATTSAADERSILERMRRAGVDHGEVIESRAGLRPYRPSVRVEREGRVVHNYGHGGAGWTLCRGCAMDVAGLVTAPTGSQP